MKTLCTVRDIYRSIRDFEFYFQQKYDLCLNEGMLLCTLSSATHSSSGLADELGLTHSNTSKVIRSVEDKGFVERKLGKDDKRQMYFHLTEEGKRKLGEIRKEEAKIADMVAQIAAIVTA